MMEGYRQSPPVTIDGEAVVTLLDYELQLGKNLQTGATWKLNLPKSNVLQFITAKGSKISARPSGTEPKIKFYSYARAAVANGDDLAGARKQARSSVLALRAWLEVDAKARAK